MKNRLLTSIAFLFLTSHFLSAQSITGTVSFVDGAGSNVLSYSVGDSLYVLVNDADRNLDASALDTVSVYISSDKEAVEEVLVLTETGNDTHLFTAFMSFDASGAVASDGSLQVDRGNKLTARYRDPQDDFNNTTNHTTNSFYGMTVINGGTLAGDTTWNPAGSPYLLTGDVTVPLGSVLTIDAGTEVRFTPLSDDLSSGEDNNRIELRVEGRLEVKGTATDSVFFKSNGQVPASGDWYGIVSYGNEGEVHMGYSSLNHYTNGVYTTGGEYTQSRNNGDSIYMHHNSFYAGGNAFHSPGSGSDLNRPIVFLYNELHQCGVYDRGYTAYRKYEHNTVKAGTSYESFEIGSSGVEHSFDGYLSVSYNTFEKGRVYLSHINVYDNATNSIHVSNNTFGSGSYGIRLNSLHNYTNATDNIDISILNNTIEGRHDGSGYYSGYGTYLSLREKGGKVRFENNQISGVLYGLYITSNNVSNATISNNSIDSASYQGFYLDKVSGTIESNTLSYCSRDNNAIVINSDFNNPSVVTLQYNTITGTGYGGGGLSTNSAAVNINGQTNVLVNYNNIFNNYSYDIINNVASSVRSQLDAKYNYWGDSTIAEINNGPNPKNISKFYDQYDDSNLGLINYGGYLNAAYPGGVPSSQSITGTVSFVDGAGSNVLSYSVGDSLYVLVNDADRNLDASALDTVSVYISSDKEAVEEVLVLTETGNDTHLFTAFMSFDASGAVASDGSLQVDRGNKLTARYRDPQDDFNNTTNHTTNSFYGMTVINGGTLAGDTTWNPAGSPYLLTGDVTVPLGSVLTIDAGTEVRFTPLSDDLSSGEDNNRIELRVEGRLEVKGTATDSVFFKSNGQVPASGDWYGIVSYGNEGEVHMGYSSLNHYTNGVYTTGGEYTQSRNNGDSIYMHHNSFYAGGNAFHSPGSGSDLNRPIVFLYNELHQCGVYDRGYTAYRKYEHNTVKAGTSYESFEIGSSGVEHSFDGYLSVSYNTFEKGRVYLSHINVYDNATNSIHVSNNTFGSGSYGIRLNSLHNYTNATDNIDISILNNTIEGRHDGSGYYSGYGTYLSLREKGGKVRFENNQISGVLYGLYITSNNVSNATISNNSIDSASYQGFYLDKVSGTIESNTLSYCSRDNNAIVINSDFNNPSVVTLQYNTITGTGYGGGIINQ